MVGWAGGVSCSRPFGEAATALEAMLHDPAETVKAGIAVGG